MTVRKLTAAAQLSCHAEIVTAQAACQPIDALADIAVVEIQLGEENSMFTPIKPPPFEDATPPPVPVAAPPPAKAPAKGAPAKAAAKGPAKGAVAAADQPPSAGAPELGRALELLGAQVLKYYAWREGATVYALQPEPVTQDDLAGYRSLLSDLPQVSQPNLSSSQPLLLDCCVACTSSVCTFSSKLQIVYKAARVARYSVWMQPCKYDLFMNCLPHFPQPDG